MDAWVRSLAAESFGGDAVRDFPWGNRGVEVLTEGEEGFLAVAWTGPGRDALDIARDSADLPFDAEAGYVAFIAVEEGARGGGLAGRLLDRVLDEASGMGIALESVAWDANATPPHGLFLSRGFRKEAVLRGIWGDGCTVCGSTPCQCTGTLFRWDPV